MIQITWLGHGTFTLKLASGEVVVIDPWLENPKFPAGYALARVDAILITHGHFDHLADAVPLAKRHGAKVIANYEISTYIGAQGVENVSGMNKGGTQAAGSLRVTMTHALHSSGIAHGNHFLDGGDAAGYVLHFADGRKAYFAGDTAVFGDMALIAELYQPTLAFLPIGDLYTMDPVQAALACRLLNIKTVIPMHYGTFPPLTGRPSDLAQLVEAQGVRVWALEPGKPVEW
jgi:L-ascorbate metabolism protein UlaG (beta-lactamase superfamily)